MKVNALEQSNSNEALLFLSQRPVDNVIMSGFMRDNGVVSPQNRGTFFGCWNRAGSLEGVALVGHGITFDSRSEAATEMFAHLAKRTASSHLLMGERDQVRSFWRFYSPRKTAPRRLRDVAILELRHPFKGCEQVHDLRPAMTQELDAVTALHARMVAEETGDDPLLTDPESFRQRCLRRIKQGRTWVWFKDARIIYKADVIAQTSDVAYIEGVYVSPEERGKGYGRRCLAQMGTHLLAGVTSVCLFADEHDDRSQNFYTSIGYLPASRYSILYF